MVHRLLSSSSGGSGGMMCEHLHSSVGLLSFLLCDSDPRTISLSPLFSSSPLICFFLSGPPPLHLGVFLSTDAHFSLRSAVLFSHSPPSFPPSLAASLSASLSLSLSFALCVKGLQVALAGWVSIQGKLGKSSLQWNKWEQIDLLSLVFLRERFRQKELKTGPKTKRG